MPLPIPTAVAAASIDDIDSCDRTPPASPLLPARVASTEELPADNTGGSAASPAFCLRSSVHAGSMSIDDESFSGSALSVGIAPVVDGTLYIGPLKAVAGPLTCHAMGIGAYLCVAKEVSMPAHVMESGAPSLHVPLRDAADECLATHLPAALAFIDAQTAAGRRVVVFCQQGRSRSAAVAAAYVQRRVEGVADSAAAVTYLTRRYPRAELNMSFLRQLQQ